MKAPFKIITAGAVAAALVGVGFAGPAAAATDTAVTVTPVISLLSASGVVPALTASVPVGINTNALGSTDLSVSIAFNGAVYNGGSVYQDYTTGNASVDLIASIERGVSNYAAPAAGTYVFTFVSTQDTHTTYSPDYSSSVTTTYLPAQSAPLTLTVAQLKTKISGFSTKTKKIKHGAYLSKKIDKFTVSNAGGAKVTLQYKKKGGSWKSIDSVSTSVYSSSATKLTDGYRYNQALKSGGKSYPRGTQYFRILVKGTVYSSGATSKAFKFVVK